MVPGRVAEPVLTTPKTGTAWRKRRLRQPPANIMPLRKFIIMNEEEFLNSIDCCFPYENEGQWRALILQGKAISDNASFGVLEEICRKPYGNPVSEKEQLAMVE